MKGIKIATATVLTILFGKVIPMLAVFLILAGLVVIITKAIEEGKSL